MERLPQRHIPPPTTGATRANATSGRNSRYACSSNAHTYGGTNKSITGARVTSGGRRELHVEGDGESTPTFEHITCTLRESERSSVCVIPQSHVASQPHKRPPSPRRPAPRWSGSRLRLAALAAWTCRGRNREGAAASLRWQTRLLPAAYAASHTAEARWSRRADERFSPHESASRAPLRFVRLTPRPPLTSNRSCPRRTRLN